VKLTANGKSSSQVLTVKTDPRIGTPEGALRQEFVAASRVSALLGEVGAAQEQAEALQKHIAARKSEAGGNAEVGAEMAALAGKVNEVTGIQGEEEFGFLGLRLPGVEPATLHQVATALTSLLMIVDGAAPPPGPPRRALEQWEAAGADTLSRWSAVLEKAKVQLRK
jgi:hypothetical protein